MALENSSDVKLEIGHALLMDIVGYSKLLIHEQSELQRQLNEIVRGTDFDPQRIFQDVRNGLIPAHWRTTGAVRGAVC
jgi:hypothetical protein